MPGLIAALITNLLLAPAAAWYVLSRPPLPGSLGSAPLSPLVVVAWVLPAAYVAWVGVRSDQRRAAQGPAGQVLATVLVGLAGLQAAFVLSRLHTLLALDKSGFPREIGPCAIELGLVPYLGFLAWSAALGGCVLTAPGPAEVPAPRDLVRHSWWLPAAALLGGVGAALFASGARRASRLGLTFMSAVLCGIGLYLVTRPAARREWGTLTAEVEPDFDPRAPLWQLTKRQWGLVAVNGLLLAVIGARYLPYGSGYLIGVAAVYLVIVGEKALLRRRLGRK